MSNVLTPERWSFKAIHLISSSKTYHDEMLNKRFEIFDIFSKIMMRVDAIDTLIIFELITN